MKTDDKIYVAGHTGLVGSAIARALAKEGFANVVVRTRAELDLTDGHAVQRFFASETPRYVFLAAARVGGIRANVLRPAEFIRDNLLIQCNVIDAAHRVSASKLLFLGSSCIYPARSPRPIPEEALLTAPPETTNAPYALAKIAGLAMCDSYNCQFGTNFIAAMPADLAGPNDNFDLETAHVLPAFIRRFHEAAQQGAETVELWGTGKPRREFLYVDDLADALLLLMQKFDAEPGRCHVNVGSGIDLPVAELAARVARVAGYEGRITWNHAMPDGFRHKLLDVTRVRELGWREKHSIDDTIRKTYQWFVANVAPAARALSEG